MESKIQKEEKDSKDTEKKPEDENPKELTRKKSVDDNIILNFSKNSLKKDHINKEEKSEQKDKIEKPKNKQVKPNSENNFLSDSIAKLQNGDDMDIMNELIALSEKLPLSSNEISDNPNMPKLLEVICNNLEKINVPKLIIYTLKCINYILDINPSLTSILKRVGAIPKIKLLISTMKDTECLELIVSMFEKISYKNSFLLLENNVLPSLLNIIDILGFPQRKSIMKTCQNISSKTITYRQFDQYIKPAMEKLCNLTKFIEDNSYVNKKAIFVYYNIIFNLNKGYYFNNNPELENEISKYNFMDNFCEILKQYYIENNKKMAQKIIKKIFKTINIIFQVSKKETKKLLSLNFLGIVAEILHHEFNDVIKSQNNTKTISKKKNNNNKDVNSAKSNSSFLAELFSSLIALFPVKKDNNIIDDLTENKNDKKIDEKILRKDNEKYYDYLCTNIIKALVNNILNKPTCSTLNNLVELIIVFSKTASKDCIQNYINPNQIALIINKILDTKYEPYILNLISFLEIFMTKAPEHFIQNIISEGIIENFKNYENKKQSTKSSKIKNKKNLKKENKESDNKNKEKDSDSSSYISDKDYNIKEYSDEDSDEDSDENNDNNQNDEKDNDFSDNEKQNESGKEDKVMISLDLNSSEDKKDKEINDKFLKK